MLKPLLDMCTYLWDTTLAFGWEIVHFTHPVRSDAQAFLEAVAVLVAKVANRLRRVHPLVLCRQDFRVAILRQPGINAGHLQNCLRKFLDRMRRVTSDVVGLAR